MINKKELRYGNLVYTWDTDYEFGGSNQFLEQVEEVRKNVVEFKTSHAAYNEIEPIELNPEWLERCGFVKLMHLGRNEYSLWIDEGLTIEALFIVNNRTEEIVVRLVTTNENDDENIPLGSFVTYRNVNCKYLHQIQNLYFAHTGEELQIKLP